MPESVPNAPAPAADLSAPPGFRELTTSGPFFLRAMGPTYIRRTEAGGLIVALRVAEQHLNIQGVAHGGMLTTLADGALGMNLAIARGRRGAQVTVSMTADFLSSARAGDWLEAHVTVTRMGQRLAYASCDLKVGERAVLRSSAVFAFVDRPLPPHVSGSTAALVSDG